MSKERIGGNYQGDGRGKYENIKSCATRESFGMRAEGCGDIALQSL